MTSHIATKDRVVKIPGQKKVKTASTQKKGKGVKRDKCRKYTKVITMSDRPVVIRPRVKAVG